jgi:hypothetical protein
VRTYVEEPWLGHFPSGAKVTLTTDSRPDKPYHGVVGFVSPTAEFTPKSVETPDLRTHLVYRLRIVVQDPDPALRQGMPVTVRLAAMSCAIPRGSSPNALASGSPSTPSRPPFRLAASPGWSAPTARARALCCACWPVC